MREVGRSEWVLYANGQAMRSRQRRIGEIVVSYGVLMVL